MPTPGSIIKKILEQEDEKEQARRGFGPQFFEGAGEEFRLRLGRNAPPIEDPTTAEKAGRITGQIVGGAPAAIAASALAAPVTGAGAGASLARVIANETLAGGALGLAREPESGSRLKQARDFALISGGATTVIGAGGRALARRRLRVGSPEEAAEAAAESAPRAAETAPESIPGKPKQPTTRKGKRLRIKATEDADTTPSPLTHEQLSPEEVNDILRKSGVPEEDLLPTGEAGAVEKGKPITPEELPSAEFPPSEFPTSPEIPEAPELLPSEPYAPLGTIDETVARPIARTLEQNAAEAAPLERIHSDVLLGSSMDDALEAEALRQARQVVRPGYAGEFEPYLSPIEQQIIKAQELELANLREISETARTTREGLSALQLDIARKGLAGNLNDPKTLSPIARNISVGGQAGRDALHAITSVIDPDAPVSSLMKATGMSHNEASQVVDAVRGLERASKVRSVGGFDEAGKPTAPSDFSRFAEGFEIEETAPIDVSPADLPSSPADLPGSPGQLRKVLVFDPQKAGVTKFPTAKDANELIYSSSDVVKMFEGTGAENRLKSLVRPSKFKGDLHLTPEGHSLLRETFPERAQFPKSLPEGFPYSRRQLAAVRGGERMPVTLSVAEADELLKPMRTGINRALKGLNNGKKILKQTGEDLVEFTDFGAAFVAKRNPHINALDQALGVRGASRAQQVLINTERGYFQDILETAKLVPFKRGLCG